MIGFLLKPCRLTASLAAVFAILFLASGAMAQEFIDVGGKEVDLNGLVFTAPEGWVRAPAEVEKAEENFMLGLVDPKSPGGGLALTVSIAFSSDKVENAAQEKAFREGIEKSLTKEGWRPVRVESGGVKFQAFGTAMDGGTLYLILVPRDGRIYQFYAPVSGPGKGVPDSVLQLVAAAAGGGPKLTIAQFDEMVTPKVAREDMAISNIFYGGDIADDTDVGRETKKWHRTVADAVEENCRVLDEAYDRLTAANDRFNMAVFELQGAAKAADPKAAWLAEADEKLESLVETMVLEKALRSGIADLRSQIAAVKEPLAESRIKGHLELMLLDLYAQTGQLQLVRAVEIMSYFTANHHTRLSPLTPEVRKKLAGTIRAEEEAIIASLAGDQEVQAALLAVATGMTGIKEVMRVSLELNVARLEEGVAEVEARLKKWKAPKGMTAEASLMKDTLVLYKDQLEDLKQARDILERESKSWVGRQETETQTGQAPSYVMLASLEPVGAYMVAVSESTGFDQGDRMASAYVDAGKIAAQPMKTVGYFQRAFKVVQNTVGGAASAASMATKVIADKYYGWSYKLSEKDTRAQVHRTIAEHMEEYKRGEVGKGAMRQAITSFENVEKGAENAAAGSVEKVIGKGWVSWGAGKVANAAASNFTSLGKGSLQITAHDSTPGERLEGVVNVVSSLVGVSSTVTQPLTKSAGKAMGLLVNQAKNTAKTLVESKAGIEVEKTVMRELGESFIPEAQKNITKYTAQRIAATDQMKKAMVDGLKEVAEGGVEALTPASWAAIATKALAEAGQEIGLKEMAAELLKRLGAESLLHDVVDNEVTAKVREIMDGRAGEGAKPEEQGQETGTASVKPSSSEKEDEAAKVKKGDEDQEAEEENEEGEEEEVDEAEEGDEVDEGDEGEEEVAEKEKTGGILDYVKPIRVKAVGACKVATQGPKGATVYMDVTSTVTFWNVGAMGGPEYAGATFHYVAAAGGEGANTMNGQFSGGPNGSINLGEVSISVVGGTSVVIPDFGTIPIQNPGAFADWPK